MTARLGVVVIGRNEGARLARCLESIRGGEKPIVYVDSGSTDGSLETARSMGVATLALDPVLPFTAARGRDEGLRLLLQVRPEVQYVQFVDGDSEIVAGWLDHALQTLTEDQTIGAVCGRLRERSRESSIYAQLCDMEWNGPVGDLAACGGIAMYRADAYVTSGGFNPLIAAGEEGDLCRRLCDAGYRVVRIPAEMGIHDSGIAHLGDWWRRAVRSGYGAMDICCRFDPKRETSFVRQVRSARLWTLGLLLVTIGSGAVCASTLSWRSAALVAGIFSLFVPVQIMRLTCRALRRSAGVKGSLAFGVFTIIAKWAHLVGQCRYIASKVR